MAPRRLGAALALGCAGSAAWLCAPAAGADPAILAKLDEMQAAFAHLRQERLDAIEIVRADSADKEQPLKERLRELEAAKDRRLHSNASDAQEVAWRVGNNTDAEAETTRALADLISANNHSWILLCGALVMFMQAGFAMVEAGVCRQRNVQNILMKNMVDVCLGTLCFWSVGWGLAYGRGGDENAAFANKREFFGTGFTEADKDGIFTPSDSMLNWFFQWTFCSAASTIVSGGVAERVMFPGYLVFTVVMSCFIYPVVVHWTWGYGWLSGGDDYQINKTGFMDFAGSGIVHMCGGVAALIGAAIAGPRVGRFTSEWESFDPHSLPMVILGTFILWFGWYGFNCGSTLSMATHDKGAMAAQVAMNTTLSAASSGLTLLILRYAMFRKYDVGGMCNGILAGLVSVTAGCGNVESGSAALIGILGAFHYQAASSLLQKLQIDDPIDAFAVHGTCGAWGVFAAALFDWGTGTDYFNGWNGWTCVGGEGNCTSGAWAEGLAANIAEIFAISAWTAGWSIIVFLPLRIMGLLRAQDDVQEKGMDASKHSPEKAYTLE